MGISNNSPTMSYIHISGISVVWNNETYMVQDFATNKKYIYWNADFPHQLNASNVMPSRSTKQYLVIVNDNGMHTLVPPTSDDFSISFEGNSNQAIKDRIFGLYEKNEHFGNKFVAIEENIDGIKSVIGTTEETPDGTLVDRISKVEQSANEINLSVEEISKKYNDDKETNELRENLNSSIIKLNSTLGTFKSELTDYFKNNEVSSEEQVKIKTQLEILKNNKIILEGYVNTVRLIAESNNQTQDVVALDSAKKSLQIAHDNLHNNVTNAIIDSIISPTENTIIIDSFAKYNLKINELKNTCDDIIILGVGGVITEELANISIKSNEIKLSVSKVEEDFKNDMSIQKLELKGQIDDVNDSVGALEDTMHGAFQDGILSESEKIAIRQNLSILASEKSDIDKQYTTIYANADLTGTPKTNLKTAYDNYVVSYNSLISTINTILGKSSTVNSTDRNNLTNAFNTHNTKLGLYTVSANNALDSIAAKKAQNESSKIDKKYADIILTPETGILSKVEHFNKQINGDGGISERLQIAEEQITDEAITQTVKDMQFIKDMNGKITTQAESLSKIDQRVDKIDLSVSKKVDSNSIISAINLSPESIKISSSKINITGFVTFTDLSTPGSTTISGSNIITGTLDTNKVNIKGSTTKKIVIGNDNYCVYDGAETDINRKVFVGFRTNSATNVPSVMLGYNGINPSVDGAVVSGGTYTTYSHYPNNNNPESINQSYGALAFKYGAGATQFSTLNMYQNGDIDLKAGSGIYFRPSLRNKNNHVFGMTDTEVGCRVPFKCTSTIFTNGDITTDRNVHAYGNISASGSMSCGTILPSNISIGSNLSINSNGIYTSGHITGNMVKTDSYRFTNNHIAFGKSDYNNNMMNGCNWDWQYFNLVNVKVYPVSLNLPTIDEPTIQTISETQKDTLSQIKFPEVRELSVEESAPSIDISDVTNKEEITTNGDVDLIKLVYLLVKNVQNLKQENEELLEIVNTII